MGLKEATVDLLVIWKLEPRSPIYILDMQLVLGGVCLTKIDRSCYLTVDVGLSEGQ